MPVKLLRLQENKYNIGRILSTKFLGALLMKDFIKYT